MIRDLHLAARVCVVIWSALGVCGGVEVSGVVRDGTGGLVAGAAVELAGSSGVVARSTSSPSGRFVLTGAGPGSYSLRVRAEGFAEHEAPVRVESGPPVELEVVLRPAAVVTRTTVSASRSAPEDAAGLPQWVTVRSREEAAERPAPTLGNVFEGELGVLVQQSTTAQVSPFLRGLTGYHVLNLIDGVRFNNSTFRSGPNQYLAYVEPSQAERMEAMLGPSGALYGSDALGGVIQVVTAEPKYSSGGVETHAEVAGFGGSADWSRGGRAEVAVGGERAWWLAGLAGRKHGDLRGGGGDDSRNVFRRLFGLEGERLRAVVGNRMSETGFSQYGAHTKLALRPAATQSVTLWYQRGEQFDVRGYKDLLGGLGRLRSGFAPQTLDFLYGRWEKWQWAGLDTISGTLSWNRQRDGSERQNLLVTDPVTVESAEVDSFGYHGQGAGRVRRVMVVFGGEVYDEHVGANRAVTSAPGAAQRVVRALYPDGSRYRTYSGFGQGSGDLAGRRLRWTLGGRWTGVKYWARAQPAFGVAAATERFRDVSYQTSLLWQARRWLGLSAVVGRGFRAPNLNDLGAIGLNDLGYEIPAREAIAAGALVGSSAGEGALSLGVPVRALLAERLFNYEAGIRVTARQFYGRVQVFDAEMKEPIVRRTLLFPASRPPARLADFEVKPVGQTAGQAAQGVVGVATALDPRAVKAFVNDGESKYYGIEALARQTVGRWSIEGNYSFLVGRDLHPNRPIRRLPPQMGAATLRYMGGRGRWWVECSVLAAGTQRRLSGGDLDDERIGASRRRRDIAEFFQGGRVRPYLNGEGLFVPTGETLRQVQDRVMPLGDVTGGVRVADDGTRAPLYRSTAGWAAASVRGGFRVGERTSVNAAVENVLDRNYRWHGSGVDGAGRNAYVQVKWLW